MSGKKNITDFDFNNWVKQIAREEIPITNKKCEVISYDEDKKTCKAKSIIDENLVYFNVSLTATLGGSGLLILPKVGSFIFVGILEDKKPDAYVSMFTEIDKVLITCENGVSMELKDILKLNGDGFGGLIKIAELVNRMNANENKLNSLISKYNVHLHPVAALPNTVTPPVLINTLVPSVVETPGTLTTKQQLENTKVTHG